MINDQATTLVIPGQAAASEAVTSGGPMGGLVAELFSDVSGVLIWLLPLIVVVLGMWVATNGRRRRRIDPRELAFRRISHAQGWSRSQVRALRQAASAAGLASPVGLSLSPALVGRVFAEGGTRSGGRATPGD